jgi:hypothetical protein
MTLVVSFDKSRSPAGIALPYAVLIGGAMLIGRVNSFSDVPWASYLMIPLAAATLWLSLVGPLAKTNGMRHRLVQTLPVLVSAVAVILALVAEMGGRD